jgi:hypothetical protein
VAPGGVNQGTAEAFYSSERLCFFQSRGELDIPNRELHKEPRASSSDVA